MNVEFKISKYWMLGLALFVLFSFLGLTLIIENNIPVDGLLKIGFPLVFYTKGYFPSNETIHFPNLLIDLSVYFLSALGITLIIRYLATNPRRESSI
ncbi:MAG: hypothetical protein ACFFCZ_22120 [Promethearchaeota archaeon]